MEHFGRAHLFTGYVERQTLTMRMSMRQFIRLPNTLWEKIENLECAIMLRLMCCNSSRIRQSLARQRNACSAPTRVLHSHPLLTKGMRMQRFHQVNTTLVTSILLVAFATVAGAQGLKTVQEIMDFSASKTSAYKTWSADCNQVVNMMGSQVAMNGQMVQKLPHSMWMQFNMPMMGQQSKLTTVMGQDGIMWQMCSMQSSSKMLLRHTIMFKAMLLAAKDFESRDFLACDLFKRLLPFARDHC